MPDKNLGHGVGLRSEHFSFVLQNKPAVDWFEAISENFMNSGGRPRKILRKVREDYPIALHATSLSIGSTDPLHQDYLKALKNLADEIEPSIISDHLCWGSVRGAYLHDLLPLPFTQEAVQHVVNRVDAVQSFLGCRMLLENVSAYVTYFDSEMPEWEFLKQVSEKSGCGILLDVNNIYVNAVNHGFDASEYLMGIPTDRVFQYHISGHTDMNQFLFDTHHGHVIEPVWKLYGDAVKRFGDVSSLIEWDSDIESFDQLRELSDHSRKVAKDAKGRPFTEGALKKVPFETFEGERRLPHIQAMWSSFIRREETEKSALFEKTVNIDQKVERLEIYREGYQARLYEAFGEVFPATAKVLGERQMRELILLFVTSRSSGHFGLDFSVSAFAEDLGFAPKLLSDYPFLQELMKFEVLVFRAFHAFHQEKGDLSQVSENTVFKFQTSVSIMSSRWPVLDIWKVRDQDYQDIQIDLNEKDGFFLVFRKLDEVFCEKVEADEFFILQQLMKGFTLEQVCEELAEKGLTPDMSDLFARWQAKELFYDFQSVGESSGQ